MEEFVSKIEEIIVRENAKLKDELRAEFQSENAKLKDELKTELKSELKTELKTELGDELGQRFSQELTKQMNELRKSLSEELRKEVLDRMFVFEENYGRSINIMFEEIMCKNKKDRNMEKDIIVLERRVDKNSAFIMSHENRIATLEEAKI